MDARVAAVRQKFEAEGQGHVLAFYDKLDKAQQEDLVGQLEKLDVKRVLATYKLSISDAADQTKQEVEPLDEVVKLHSMPSKDKEEYEKAGLEAVKGGRCAFLLLAGGQGTRLGTSDPKGCYNIGLPSGSSLFQLMADRLTRLKNLAGAGTPGVPWYVMTSPMTDDATRHFFKVNAFFGLNEDDVVFFQQGTLPCLSIEGNILMESPHKVSCAPDGNGGIYRALAEAGALSHMKKKGVEFVHASSVDNALVLPCDPLFMGYAISVGADCGAKVCPKASAKEAVGVICKAQGGGARVVEYTEIDEAKSAEIGDKTGELKLNAGNICNHFYTTKFLETAATLPTPYHIAKKKIPCVNEKGETVKPDANNGVKLEQFIFDCFPESKKFACAEVIREEEFAPVKNAPGAATDSPDTARKLLLQLGRKYAVACGCVLEGGVGEGVEVCPLVSYRGEGLEAWKGKMLKEPALIK